MNVQSGQTHVIYISVGSNVDKDKHTRAGLDGMFQVFGELQLSSVYESESVGFSGNNFYNLVVKAKTAMAVEDVCKALKQIEKDNKRQRHDQKFSPRTLDLDLLLYDQLVIKSPIELPRAEVLYNAFVLKPLAEIAGQQIHPVVNKSYATLWQEYDKTQQHLWVITFEWSSNQK